MGGSANITGSFFGGNTTKGGAPRQLFNDYDSGYGGAVYVGGGTVTLSGDTFHSNSAQGPGGLPQDGSGYGGGLCLAGGTVTLTNDYVTSNQAGWQDQWGYYEAGYGGGIYAGLPPGEIGPAGKVYLDSFTLAHTVYNTPNNIWGTYVLLP